MDCLDPNEIVALLESDSIAASDPRVATHLAQCDDCRMLVSAATRASFATSADKPAATVHVGRFEVLGTLGVGGSGHVLSARDPQLQRVVALKVLHADATEEIAPEKAQARLLDEARAMARVAHPNIVTVHEVGSLEDEVFVAMEYVQGSTLRGWLEAEPRTLETTLQVLRQAGEGLAAAHEAGIVHRDFKPENVLVGEDGRVRVTDFGLSSVRARPLADEGLEQAQREALDVRTTLTRTGAVMGTPRYMAPEQHRGERVDARCDQFAFCVTLHEALCGELPFAGEDYPSLRRAVLDGALRTPPARLPAYIRRVLRRGLAGDPAARFANMPALLAALQHDPGRRWTRYALAGAALAAVATLGVGQSAFELAPATPPTNELRASQNGPPRDAAEARTPSARPALAPPSEPGEDIDGTPDAADDSPAAATDTSHPAHETDPKTKAPPETRNVPARPPGRSTRRRNARAGRTPPPNRPAVESSPRSPIGETAATARAPAAPVPDDAPDPGAKASETRDGSEPSRSTDTTSDTVRTPRVPLRSPRLLRDEF